MREKFYSPLFELTLWRVREFVREPEAMFWVFAFPILLALALGIAFKNRGPTTIKVAVEAGREAAALTSRLNGAPDLAAETLPGAEANDRLRSGKVNLVVVPGEPIVFRFDSTRSESQLARLVVKAALRPQDGADGIWEIREERVTEPGTRYIDFLIPGLLGMNIMGTGLWGIGFGVVKNRNQKLLKRLLASPMKRSEYLLSHILARLVFLGFEVGALLLFGHLAFGVPVRGSLIAVALIAVLGAMAFSGLGLLVASRARTLEGVSGLMNVVMVPMWICSGVFFSYANFPEAMQPIIKALPLTALNDALRAVMIDGVGLAATAGALGVVAAWGIASFGTALKVFRWV